MDRTQIKRALREFILRSVRVPALGDDEDLFESGIVNSLFAVQLMTFVEKTFAIEVAMELWAVAHGVASLLIGVHDFPWPDDFADRVLKTYVRGLTSAAVTSS